MNMLIEMNLDEKTYAKIKKLLENGIYEDEKQVISRAIENLYERTMATKEIQVSSEGYQAIFEDIYDESVNENKQVPTIADAIDAIVRESKTKTKSQSKYTHIYQIMW